MRVSVAKSIATTFNAQIAVKKKNNDGGKMIRY